MGILFWPLVGVKYEVIFSCWISCNNSRCVCGYMCVCIYVRGMHEHSCLEGGRMGGS